MKKANTLSIRPIPCLINKTCRLLALVLLCYAPLAPAAAHGDLHEAIERKSRQIEEKPGDILLLFERGMLYQEHGETGQALADFHRVLRLEPAYYVCHLPISQLYLAKGLPRKALFHINLFLEKEPGNPFGHEALASVYQMMGWDVQAVASLRRMIALKNSNAIRPDDYFRLADGILRASPGSYGEAIAALEEGAQRLGDIISLQSKILDLEIESRRYTEALERIGRIMAPLARKEKWLAKKEQVLGLMRQPDAAYEASRQAGAETPSAEGGESGGTGLSAITAPGGGEPAPPHSNALASVTRGPYLQSGTPNSMVLKWRTNTATTSKVWYGASPSSLALVAEQSGTRKNHEIKITGLMPNTRYYYAIGHSEGILAGETTEHFFQTSPPHGTIQPVRAWVLGDCGTGDSKAREVRDGYYSYAGNNLTDLILLLGDNAYDDGKDSEYQAALFENMYEGQLIQSVLWSTPGNHDYGSASASSQTGPYFDIFTFPKNGEAGGLASGTEAYYSFDYANIHFVSLDSHDSGREPGDPMLVWLENDLHATQQDWTIVLFHHPPYSKGSHDSDEDGRQTDIRENVLPILEAAGVDLVLSGHSHSYERSYLLNGHYGLSSSLEPHMVMDDGNGRMDDDGAYRKDGFGPAAGKGAVYVVAGSSGKVSDGPLDHPVMYYNALTLGSLSLEITDKRLDLKFIGVEGEVLDYFTLLKFIPVGNPPAVAVSSPANGAFYHTPQAITLRAQASDSDGEVRELVFFVNGDSVAVDHAAPYSHNWTPPSEGRYIIKARAKDDDGNAVTSSEVAINVGYIEACSRIGSREDDAEEGGNGSVSLSSTDLELINDPSDGNQMAGMRFTGLNIPRNALITDARIQFTVEDNNYDNPCSLVIYGQDSDDAAPFSGADFDLSSRPLTEASVNWSPPNWPEIGAAGPSQQTPNLAPIIQEIVSREGFAPSSAFAFLVEGQGRRTAESYDGIAFAAPRLCVRYTFCAPFNLQASSSAASICAGESATLSAGPAASYLWSTGQTTASIIVQPTQSTTYSLTAWDSNDCPATAEVSVNVHPAPQLSFGFDTLFFCPGQPATINAPAGFAQYQWSNGQNGPSASLSTPQTLTLTVTDNNGCAASASVVARQRPPLNLQVSSSASRICAGELVTLTASPAAAYLWSGGQTTRQISVQLSESTTFSLTAWDEHQCSATSVELYVEVLPLPEFSLGADTVFFCRGEAATITAPAGFAQYQWSNGDNGPSVSLGSPQSLALTVTDSAGCKASDSIEAQEYPPFSLQISSSADSICVGEEASLSASPAGSYLWSNGETSSGINVQIFENTTFGLSAWDENGCLAMASAFVAAVPPPDFTLEQDGNRLQIIGLDDPEQYTILWNTGETATAIIAGSSDLYCATVTDALGCFTEACTDVLISGAFAHSSPPLWEIFPNPFDDVVRIRPAQAAARPRLQILVFDALGQPVPFHQEETDEEVILSFHGLPPGVYMIVISDKEGVRTATLIKQ